MTLSREQFRRAKRRLDRHLYFVYFGGLLSLFLGGALITVWYKPGAANWPAAKFCLAAGFILMVTGPVVLPVVVIRNIRRSDVIRCPECKVNLLKKADRVMNNSCCYNCGAEVLGKS
jgi:hypothetical protein